MKTEEIKRIETKEVVVCDQINNPIENRIITIRGVQVILDRDLAELYGVKTSRLNEQVKRNIKRFPERYRFQLTEIETNELIAICDRFESLKHSSFCPYAFSEHGVVMLSSVLHSDEAIEISGRVVDAFVAMRRFLAANAPVFQRLEHIEYKLLENDHKFDQVFAKLEEKSLEPKQGIFYDGQIFDAYEFVSNLIRNANKRIILIDNYVNDEVLTIMTKRKLHVTATIYTKEIGTALQLDISRHNAQYPAIDIHSFNKAHDRFLIIDDKVYHIGASLKDLGKKWFAFSLMSDLTPEDLLCRISQP